MLDIVIVNWNTGSRLDECLASLSKAHRESTTSLISSIIVIDNSSSDGSARDLQYPELPLRVVVNAVNVGFGRACNQGAALCSAPYLLFLNPDTSVSYQSLAAPLALLESEVNASIGICGIRLTDANGESGCCYARFPTAQRIIFDALGVARLI